MNYKKYLEDNLNIDLDDKDYTRRQYLYYLNSLKKHSEVIIPDEEVIAKIENNEPGFIVEYALNKSGGDSSDINMEEIDLFVKRITNGYNLLKYIEEIHNKE